MSPPTYLEMTFAVRSAAEELQLTCSLGQGPLKACTLEAPPLPPSLIVPLYALVLQTLLPTVSQLALLHMILLLCPDHGDPPPPQNPLQTPNPSAEAKSLCFKVQLGPSICPQGAGERGKGPVS